MLSLLRGTVALGSRLSRERRAGGREVENPNFEKALMTTDAWRGWAEWYDVLLRRGAPRRGRVLRRPGGEGRWPRAGDGRGDRPHRDSGSPGGRVGDGGGPPPVHAQRGRPQAGLRWTPRRVCGADQGRHARAGPRAEVRPLYHPSPHLDAGQEPAGPGEDLAPGGGPPGTGRTPGFQRFGARPRNAPGVLREACPPRPFREPGDWPTLHPLGGQPVQLPQPAQPGNADGRGGRL